MNKSIIALAVAGAMAVPMVAQADATLFGELRWNLDKVKNTDATSNIDRVRFGMTGSETMDSGLEAGYFIRVNAVADGAVSMHKTTLWVAGDFGKLIFGDSGNPLERSEDRIAYSTFSEDQNILGANGFGGGAVSYESPVSNGFQLFLGVGNVDSTDDSVAGGHAGAAVEYNGDAFGATVSVGKAAITGDKTEYGVAVSTAVAGFTVGANYAKSSDAKGHGLGVKYSIDALTLAFNYESTKLTGAANSSQTNGVSASYALGGNASVTAAYKDQNTTAGDADAFKLRYAVSF